MKKYWDLYALLGAMALLMSCTAAQKQRFIVFIESIPTASETTAESSPQQPKAPEPKGEIQEVVDRSGFVATGNTVVDFCAWHGVNSWQDSEGNYALNLEGVKQEKQAILVNEYCKKHGAVPLKQGEIIGWHLCQ